VERSLAEAELEWICAADAVLCSSRNAVSALARNLEDQACALRDDALLVVPGVTTAEAARRWFPKHEVRLGDPPRASGMGAVAVEYGARRIASVGAEGGSTDGVRVAEEAGCEAHHFAAYENRVLDVADALAELPDDVVPFYLAPPAVTACPPSRFASRRPSVAMGPTTAEALGSQAFITPTPDLLGLLAILPGLGGGEDDSGG
jgi:uroporphyrinogen-III synthase